ncbi:hypothetical protein HZC53_04160 [Candidatus Uhrbacteria bacterium]|nr:hypothetical protein [Candidatus Uhrbacteria bacterium]
MGDLILLVLVLALFGGGFFTGLYRLIYRRIELSHERQLAKDEHFRAIALLQEKRRLAEATGDAVKILMVNDELGADFDRRLQKALTENQRQLPAVRIENQPAETEPDVDQTKPRGRRRPQTR